MRDATRLRPWRWIGAGVAASSLVAFAGCGSSDSTSPPEYLSRDALLDPATCGTCHADHYTDWSGSMHAYAAEDPLFLAMNARGQRETGGQLGTFCVKCHAPMAVREGATTDGTNLASLPAKLRGVTCYFCHTVDEVTGTHDAPLHLADDATMRGPLGDAVATPAHASSYSTLHDRDQLDSARLCGACHDIVNGHGAAIERTFAEWQATVFARPNVGDTCGQCHMNQSTADVQIAQVAGAPPRRYHGHGLPGVDTALVPFAQRDAQRKAVQKLLDSSIQSAVCVADGTFGVDVVLDNVAAGHGLPSGSSQDRRLWAEVVAYAGADVLYASGVVPDGQSPVATADADLWLMRDCMLDDAQQPVSMFWAAYAYESTALPGPTTLDPLDPRFYQTHVYRSFPRSGAAPTRTPDRVTMRLRMQPVGLEVIDELVASGDVDAGIRAAMPTLDVGATVEWTPATARPGYAKNGVQYSCATTTNFNFQADKVPAPSPAHCGP